MQSFLIALKENKGKIIFLLVCCLLLLGWNYWAQNQIEQKDPFFENVKIASQARLEWETCCKPVPPALKNVTAENFSFKNYGVETATQTEMSRAHQIALKAALDKLLPLGTTKVAAQSFLVNQAGATKQLHLAGNKEDVFSHAVTVPPFVKPLNWIVVIRYDEEEKLKELKVAGSGPGLTLTYGP